MSKPKVDVVVRKDHKFRGVWRKKGEVLAVTNRDAKALAALGWAVVKREAKPEEKPVEKPKREYKRRDIVPPKKVVIEPEAPPAENGSSLSVGGSSDEGDAE
jgi:hypothetical protein